VNAVVSGVVPVGMHRVRFNEGHATVPEQPAMVDADGVTVVEFDLSPGERVLLQDPSRRVQVVVKAWSQLLEPIHVEIV
jgi:hypothetical protein